MVVARAVLGDSSCDSWRQAVSSYTVATRETRPEGPRSLTHVTLIPQISRDAPSKRVVPSACLRHSSWVFIVQGCILPLLSSVDVAAGLTHMHRTISQLHPCIYEIPDPHSNTGVDAQSLQTYPSCHHSSLQTFSQETSQTP